MDYPLLTRVVDVTEDLQVAQDGELDRLLQKPLLPLAVGHFPVAQVRNQLNLINAPFAHYRSYDEFDCMITKSSNFLL